MERARKPTGLGRQASTIASFFFLLLLLLLSFFFPCSNSSLLVETRKEKKSSETSAHSPPKKNKTKKTLFSLTSSTTQTTKTCSNATEPEIAALFTKWNEKLTTYEPDQIVPLYADKSVLLPTLSNTPRISSLAKKEYFVEFMSKKPVGTILTRTIFINCETAIDTGTYGEKEGGRRRGDRRRGNRRKGEGKQDVRSLPLFMLTFFPKNKKKLKTEFAVTDKKTGEKSKVPARYT